MKKIKKYIFIVGFVCALCMSFWYKNTSAIEIGSTTYLQRADNGFLSIQKWNGNQWMYVVHSITNFVDENGVTRVAYCVNPDLNGIGYIDGEFEGYDVSIKEYLSDQRLWRVYTNGYPYKSPSEIGVENEEDAYLATKQAAFCIIRGYSVDEIRSLYRAGEDYVADEDLDEIQMRGQKVIDAMCRLVDIGYNGTDTLEVDNLLTVEEVGEISEDANNKEYYSQNYKVTCTVDFEEYSVKNIVGFPEESYVADTNGNKKELFSKGEIFKVMIPKCKIKENIEGSITVTCKCKNYPIFYSECMSGEYQNYVLCVDSYSNNVEASFITKVDAYKSKLQIFKVDKDTKKQIAGVKFSVKYEDGENIGTYETDQEGRIFIENLKQGKIIVTELECKDGYMLNSMPLEVNIGYDELKTITIENESKKEKEETANNSNVKTQEVLPRTGNFDWITLIFGFIAGVYVSLVLYSLITYGTAK